MRAVLLAAGHGTRLLPLTLETPKCLILVNGVPLMEFWFHLFRKYGINEVLINLNHLPEKVEKYVKENVRDLKIHLSYEKELLGSLGTLIKHRSFFQTDEPIFIFYSDNLTNINLELFKDFHLKHNFPFTMGLFYTTNPSACGIAELDERLTITSFIEKPRTPVSNLANAGIYLADKKIFNYIQDLTPKEGLDIGFNLLPRLVSKMKGYIIPEFLIDVGTHTNLHFATEYILNHRDEFLH